jgi:sterol desaturase/sphingolipid hydroxylase (fatty acid hydroxylase superfamily)
MHWALHQEWMGRFNKSHMTHHMTLYPPERFASEKYMHAGKDSTIIFFLIAGAPLLLAPIALFFFGYLSFFTAIVLVAELGGLGLINNYFHDSFHIQEHFLNRFSAFRKLVDLHYVHHVDMNKNFGIFTFMWDKVFKTFSDK